MRGFIREIWHDIRENLVIDVLRYMATMFVIALSLYCFMAYRNPELDIVAICVSAAIGIGFYLITIVVRDRLDRERAQ